MVKKITKLLVCMLALAALTMIPFAGVYADDAESSGGAIVTINGESKTYTDMAEGWNAAWEAVYGTSAKVVFQLQQDWIAYDMGSGRGFNEGRIMACNGDLTIDLNGHTLGRNLRSPKDYGAVIYIPQYGELYITDSNPTVYNYSDAIAGGVITGGWSNTDGGLIDMEGGELYMTGGSFVNGATNGDGGAIKMTGTLNIVEISNVRFIGNSTQSSKDNAHGGAIYIDSQDSTIELTNCSFEDNYSEDNGGAIYMNDSVQLTAKNVTFSGNTCKDDGGAVFSHSTKLAVYDNCTFYNNHADGSGGAIYTNKDGGTEIKNTEMIYNSAGKEGGAWYINDWKTYMYNVTVENNTASGKGGGIYVDSYYDTNLQGLMVIRNNTSDKEARTSNLFLQTGLGDSSQARFVNGGCDPGSEVHYGTDNNGASRVCNEMTEFQLQYFHTDEKSQELAITGTRTSEYSVASTITSTNKWVLYAGATALAAAIVIIIIFKRKNRKEELNEKSISGKF